MADSKKDSYSTIWGRLDYKAFLLEYFKNVKEKGKYYTMRCPKCGEEEAYAYKKGYADKLVIQCNRVNHCGFKASAVDYLIKEHNYSLREAFKELESFSLPFRE